MSLELFRNSLDNVPSSIVFYLEMKVKVEVVHTILGRGSPLGFHFYCMSLIYLLIITLYLNLTP